MRKFVSLMLGGLLALNASTAFAEQPKAQEYREILSSERFYVEYDDKYVKKIIIEDNGRRMERTNLSGSYKTLVSILNPFGAWIGEHKSKQPDFMCENGKYYKMLDDEYVIMARESQLDDENLNPLEGWNTIYKSLSLPDELAVFNWSDKYHRVSEAISKPEFIESIRKTVDGKEYDCDRYESKVISADGSDKATITFDMCYNKGNLVIAQSAIFANGKEYGVNKLIIKRIAKDIPKKSVKISDKTKIYAAGIGDMNDLLEIPVLLGSLKDIRN